MSILIDMIVEFLFSPHVRWPRGVTYFVVILALAVFAHGFGGPALAVATFFGLALAVWTVELLWYLRASKKVDEVGSSESSGKSDGPDPARKG